MAVSDLNIALRLDSREFEAGIRRAERAMSRATTNLTGIGNSLAVAFTAPLAAIGISALKAAGEFEKLQRGLEATMVGAGYSISQAGQELEKLREIAKAPGLDFEQAVKGSLRLQGVGLSAEKARIILQEFANGVAAAGGSSDQLDRVTVQLSQIIGKGNILNEDLKILKENMPSISAAMVRAFGTADAEGLRKLGISAEQFVLTLTGELAKSERVVGGLANSMVNAQVSIQQAAAKLGDTLNKTFNISGNLDAFGTWIVEISDRFAALDEGTQRLIIGVGVFAAALGPAIRAGGLLVSAISGGVNAAYSLVGAFARASTAGTGLIGVIKGIDLATKLTILGAAIGVVLALAVAFKTMNSEAAKTAKIQNTVEQSMLDAAATVEQQKVKVELLAGVVKDVTKTEKERNGALGELNKIIPTTNGLTLQQTDLTEKLDKATGNYIDTLIRQAQAQAAAAAIGANATKRAQLELDRKGVGVGTVTSALRATPLAFAVDPLIDKKIRSIDREIASLDALDNEYKKIIETNGGVVAAVSNSTKTFDGSTKSLKSQKDAAKESADELSRITEQLLLLNEFDQAAKDKKVVPSIPSGGGLGKTEFGVSLNQVSQLQSTATGLDAVAESLGIATTAWGSYTAAIALASEANAMAFTDMTTKATLHNNIINVIGDSIKMMGIAMGNALEDGQGAWASFAQALKGIVAEAIGAILQLYVADVIQKTFQNSKWAGYFAVPISIAAGAAAAGLMKGALNSVKLAEGGLAYAPTMATVGDNKGAASDPEVIAPLSKLQGILSKSGGGKQELYSIIRGDDLILVSDRARAKRGRYK